MNIPDDVYAVAHSTAVSRGISFALAELVRRGLKPPAPVRKTRNGFPTFAVPRQARPITLQQTLAAEDEI